MPDGVMQRFDEPVIEVVALDPAARGARVPAEQMVRRVLTHVTEPVLHVEIKLGMARDHAVERPASAEVTLNVNGHPIRAHVAARSLRVAVDLLEPRLRRRLDHRVAHRDARRRMARRQRPDEPDVS
jgi:ribosome-associated translation inhibitor RaiA